jgi:hypothetical protein
MRKLERGAAWLPCFVGRIWRAKKDFQVTGAAQHRRLF